ncbi:MAG: hypothetical protein O2819_04930 [Planctomycetota bacterium]|nr:hypothetical protein [Planctomycetota bacterium]MDA1105991.1 hypothetical protein [Planctomycetota bacterium]
MGTMAGAWQRRGRACVALCAAGAVAAALAGCFIPGLTAAIGDNIERSKDIEILAQYRGLENKTVAILFHADMAVQYEHPTAVANMAINMAVKLQAQVSGIRVLNQRTALQWMHLNPSWPMMPYSVIAEELDVERIVVVDLFEFRLTPPGNRWIWDGVAAANVGVVESDGLDSDAFSDEFMVKAEFPTVKGLSIEQATRPNVETGLQKLFLDDVAYLFYDHVVPKYPKDRSTG